MAFEVVVRGGSNYMLSWLKCVCVCVCVLVYTVHFFHQYYLLS